MADMVTVKTIAQAMQISRQRIEIRAGDEAWPFVEVPSPGRGGHCRKYPLETLPASVREALGRVAASAAAAAGRREGLRVKLEEDMAVRTAQGARQTGLARLVCLPARARSRAEARAALVAALETYLSATGKPPSTGRTLFAEAYNAGAIEVEIDVREMIPTVSANSLHNWQGKIVKEGIASLAGKYGHRKGAGLASQSVLTDFIAAMLTDHPHCSCKHIRRGLIARFGQEQTPSPRALQRFVQRWKQDHASAHLKMSNPDKWRSKYQSAAGSCSAEVERLNQRWEIDSTPGDIMLADGKRHTVVGCIDVYSRRVTLLVSRTSNATAVAACLRKKTLLEGLCEDLTSDNGSDYVSRRIQDALIGLGVFQRIAPPFTPEFKPHIERFFRTFSHDLVELLPGYIGHCVADRQDIEARKSFAQRLCSKGETVELDMTPEDFQAFCDRWANDIYAHDPHEGLLGKSPWEVAAAWTLPVAKPDPRALDVLLSAPASSKPWYEVRKKGVKVDGRWHIHPELGPHIGEEVKVLLDESDVGALYVFCKTENDALEFCCRAVDPETSGLSRQEVASMAVAMKTAQKKELAEQTAQLRKNAKRLNTKDVAREILHERAAAAGKLARLPQPTTPYETPMLSEAAIAARTGDAPTPKQPTPADMAARAALAEDMAKRQAAVTKLPETPRQRYARWMGVDAAIQAGQDVPEKDRKWWGTYQQTPEFSAQVKLREMFPEAATAGQ